MSAVLDPQGHYDVVHADSKCGTIIKGKFRWMNDEIVGCIEDDELFSAGMILGHLNGLTLVRKNKPREGKMRFELIPQEHQ